MPTNPLVKVDVASVPQAAIAEPTIAEVIALDYSLCMVTRLGLMLPGAVSLGAYEGGVLAAVLTAVQASRGEIVVDAIASASAGSMTGLIACRALLSGADPVDLMTRTWVDLPQLNRLATHDLSAPLTMDNLNSTASDLLGTKSVPDGPFRQGEPVRLSMALTALGGLTYAMPHLRDDNDPDPAQTLLATTYIDFFTAELAPGATTQDFLDVRDAAMASGSTPVGFPPRLLNRDKDAAEYKMNGILGPPPGNPFTLWYSDGGDLDNQPFGRLLDLIEQIEEQPADGRVILTLNIEPGAPPTWYGTWFDPDPAHVPSWLSTLLHVDHIRTSQSLYDDLRRLEKTNRHIAWIKQVTATLDASVDDSSRQAVSAALTQAAAQVATQRDELRQSIREAANADGSSEATPAARTLEELLLQAAGLQNKREVVVEIISPEVDAESHLTATNQLSGEFLFHFGGFFDQKYRESDFALGYRNARSWLGWWLTGRVPDPAAVLGVVDARYINLPWHDETHGDASITKLSLKGRVEGIDLLGHIEHVVAHDLMLDVAHHVDLRDSAHHLLQEVERSMHLRK